MRKEYNLAKLKGHKNPYARRLKKQENSLRKIKLTKEEMAIEQSLEEFVPVSRYELAQMKSDLKAFAERRKEPSISYKQLLKKLKKDRKI